MIKYTIATSWDNELIKEINDINNQHKDIKIIELYGSLKSSIIGSGRPSYRLPFVSSQEAEKHIKYAHENGLEFNYTLNAPDFKGNEKNPEWMKRVIEFIKHLSSIGVDTLTITHPFLIKLVKDKFPDFKVNLSLIAGVDTVEQAKQYENMGVDTIHLNPHTINRDFERLKRIVSSINCEIELYANIPCLDNCKTRDEHYKFLGHASQENENLDKITKDPFMINCSLKYLRNPIEILRSPFIRPEDIKEYSEIGISIFKLSDRQESTQFLIKTARAYMEQKYEGNLFDLIFRNGSKFKECIKLLHPEVMSMEVPIFIDNNELTKLNFIKNIRNLKGKKLEEFYRIATQRAVRCYNKEALSKLKKLLKSSL